MKILISIIADDSKVKIIQQVINAALKIKIPQGNETKILLSCQKDNAEIIKEFKNAGLEIYKIPVNENDYKRRTSCPVNGWNDLELFRRIKIVNAVLDKADGYDAILLIDGDNLMPEDVLEKLLGTNKDIVGGWYFMWRTPVIAGLGRVFKKFPKLKQKNVFSNDSIPFGCALIKKKVYKNIRVEFDSNIRNYDVLFCKKAIERGFKIYLHPEVYSEHVGNYTKLALQFKQRILKELNL